MTRRELLTAIAAAAALGPAAASAKVHAGSGPSPGAPPRVAGEHIAMLLYPGFTALDFVGPYHFLGGIGAKVHLVTNQPRLEPVPSDMGLAIQPTSTMQDCPDKLTLLFVPGGTSGTIAAARDRRTVNFVRQRSVHARYVTSVCTGSLILGAAGLLRGKRATSHWSVVPALSRFGAIPTRERVVRDGKLITGGRVSAGMDFGANVVAEMRGQKAAEAGILMAEYAPEPPFPTGTIDTAPPELVALLEAGLADFIKEASALSPLPLS